MPVEQEGLEELAWQRFKELRDRLDKLQRDVARIELTLSDFSERIATLFDRMAILLERLQR